MRRSVGLTGFSEQCFSFCPGRSSEALPRVCSENEASLSLSDVVCLKRRRFFMLSGTLSGSMTAVPGKQSQQALRDGTNRKAGDHVAGPMSKKQDSRGNQSRTGEPHCAALFARQFRCGGRQRANMYRVPRREGIEPVPG